MDYFYFQDYDFSHLNAFSLKYLYENQNKQNLSLNINISFDFHCFTKDLYFYNEFNKKILRNNIIESNIIIHKNEKREFDLLRYEQSKQLPFLIKNLFQNSKNVCFNSSKINKGRTIYFRKESMTLDSNLYEYYIFFHTIKDKQVLFYINSAYHREDLYYQSFKKNKIYLNTIIRKTLE